MATDLGPVLDMSFPAGADLSAVANQFKFVELNSGGDVTVCNAVTDTPIGVLQNRPKSGEMAEVRVFGPTKLQADAALATPGAIIGTSADGQADAKALGDAGTELAVGRTITTAAAAGEVFLAVVNCINPAKAA